MKTRVGIAHAHEDLVVLNVGANYKKGFGKTADEETFALANSIKLGALVSADLFAVFRVKGVGCGESVERFNRGILSVC